MSNFVPQERHFILRARRVSWLKPNSFTIELKESPKSQVLFQNWKPWSNLFFSELNWPQLKLTCETKLCTGLSKDDADRSADHAVSLLAHYGPTHRQWDVQAAQLLGLLLQGTDPQFAFLSAPWCCGAIPLEEALSALVWVIVCCPPPTPTCRLSWRYLDRSKGGMETMGREADMKQEKGSLTRGLTSKQQSFTYTLDFFLVCYQLDFLKLGPNPFSIW